MSDKALKPYFAPWTKDAPATESEKLPDRPFVTMTLIAKDERHNIDRCFSSWWDIVNEVVLCDTGSTDGTVEKARAFARKRKQPEKLKIVRYKWNDDFAAARQAADDAATGEWLTWCDLDDTINGLPTLVGLAKSAGEEVLGYFVRYSYAQDQSGNTISELWRERLVRNNGIKWEGRLHEHKIFTGGTVVKVDPSMAEWVHHRNHEERTGERNLRILEAWDREEPNNARIIGSLALELMGAERHKEASDMFAKLLACPGEPPDRRAQSTRHMCVMLMMQGRTEEAREAAMASLNEMWLWADTHLTMAEIEQTIGHPEVAIVHAQTALSIGKPDTVLIVNPLQYTAHPRALIAICLAQMGRIEEATAMAEECLEIAPTYSLASQQMPLWRGQLRKQNAMAAFLACTEVLVETGELLKARSLLTAAPWYVADDPRLIQKRSELKHLIDRRIESPEVIDDKAADAFVARHLEMAA